MCAPDSGLGATPSGVTEGDWKSYLDETSSTNEYRVGRSLGTTIYRVGGKQPCAWVPGDPQLAGLIVALLNTQPPDIGA